MPQASIFIVDDDPEVRGSLRCLLASEARRVWAYASAGEFLEDFAPAHPCCLLLDLRLPGMTGQELLERMRAGQADIPVIIITAHADVPAVLRAMRRGAVDVCPKPVDPQALLALVERTLADDARRAGQLARVADARRRLARLTPRERQLFTLVLDGQSNKEMGATLGISPRTVEHHRAHIAGKLGMDRVADLVRLGLFAQDQDAPPPADPDDMPHPAAAGYGR